jgi:CHAT domain-containing protein
MGPRRYKFFLPAVLAGCLLAITSFYAQVPFGNWLLAKGIEARKDWKLDKAITYFKWAGWFSDRQDEITFEKGVTYQLQGDFIRSKCEFEDLLIGSIINQKFKARILNSNGVNFFNQNNPDKALLSHRESLKIARLINDKKLEAQSLVDLSRVLYHTQGKFDEARSKLEQALKIGREINDETIIADSLRNIGVVLWWGKGELDRPLNEFYQPALELYRKNGDRKSEAMMLSNISLIYSFKGDSFQYIKLQNESFDIREQIGDEAGLSESYRLLGSIYSSVRNFRKAREYFLKSLELSQKIGFQLNQNEAETYLAGVNVEIGQYDQAIALFKQILEREKDSPLMAKARLGSIGNCYFLKGDYEKARETFEQILAIEKKNGLKDIRSLSALYVYLGDTYLHLGKLEKAEKLLEQAEVLYLKHNAGMVQGHLGYSLTQSEFRYIKEDYERSLKFLEEAADNELILFALSGTNVVTNPFPRDYDRLFSLLLEKLNKEIPTIKGENNKAEELTFRFLEQRRYRAFRNFIVQSSNKNISSMQASEKEKDALAEIEKNKKQFQTQNSEQLKKQLRRAYSKYETAVFKEQFSKETQRAIATTRPVDLKLVQAGLDEKTAVIEYIFSRQKVFALVITKSGLRVFKLPVNRSNLKNKTRLLQSSIFLKEKNDDSNDWQPIAKSLYESLIKPIEDAGILEDKNRLAIIPFGFLHELPFAALTGDKENKTRFLVEDYILFFPPSATFLTVGKNAGKKRNMASFGINSTDKSDLPPLNFAVAESELVAEIFSGKANLEEQASETKLKRIAPQLTHLHIATHSIAEPEMPLFSRLLLKPTENDDGSLTTREIFELGIDAELVTIATCEGAKSFSADSEELIEIDRIGLTQAFLHAGSKTVLASLSPVSDKATTILMKSFYKNLLLEDKAASLAKAQREMIHDQLNKQFTHPKYWGNFILIGSDR